MRELGRLRNQSAAGAATCSWGPPCGRRSDRRASASLARSLSGTQRRSTSRAAPSTHFCVATASILATKPTGSRSTSASTVFFGRCGPARSDRLAKPRRAIVRRIRLRSLGLRDRLNSARPVKAMAGRRAPLVRGAGEDQPDHSVGCPMRSTLSWSVGLGALALSPALAATHTVTINTSQIFGTIDPAKISDYTDYMASANLYDGLANVDPKGTLVPELAARWDVSPDASSVTFHHPARRQISGRLARQAGGRRLFRRAAARRSIKDPPTCSPAC